MSQIACEYDLICGCRATLPDDSGPLKAMLLAERMQNERLRHIIKELQRHRFGRRAESLPEDLNDVDPLGYLTDVITRIVNGPPQQ